MDDSMDAEAHAGEPRQQPAPEILDALARLGDQTLISREYLAQLFCRDVKSVQRAIEDGKLPPPIELFQRRYWFVDTLLAYLRQRLHNEAQAVEEQHATVRRIGTRKGVRP